MIAAASSTTTNTNTLSPLVHHARVVTRLAQVGMVPDEDYGGR
jgi:hypothetical protein